jgi:Glycosyl hydrolase family 46
VLYDSIIQHGDGDDPDGLPALLKRTEKAAGGTPKKGIDEKKWLDVFLKIRREDLENPHAKETQKVGENRWIGWTNFLGSPNPAITICSGLSKSMRLNTMRSLLRKSDR